MLINDKRNTDNLRFGNDAAQNNFIHATTSSTNNLSSPKTSFQVYDKNNSSIVFSRSSMSTQTTIMSTISSNSNSASNSNFNSNITLPSSISSSNETLSEKIEDLESNIVDYVHNPQRNSITPTIRTGKYFDNANSSKYSIYSCKKTSITSVPKNNIVLINNVPYPVQIQFPGKISNRKSNNLLTSLDETENKKNIKVTNGQYFKSSNFISDYNSSNSVIEPSYHCPIKSNIESSKSANSEKILCSTDPYDTLLQLIQFYMD